MRHRPIATILSALVLYVLPAFAVRDGEVRNPIDTEPMSFGSVFVGVLAIGAGWLIADPVHRAVFGRAPTSEQRIVWTIGLVFGGALVVGLMRS